MTMEKIRFLNRFNYSCAQIMLQCVHFALREVLVRFVISKEQPRYWVTCQNFKDIFIKFFVFQNHFILINPLSFDSSNIGILYSVSENV